LGARARRSETHRIRHNGMGFAELIIGRASRDPLAQPILRVSDAGQADAASACSMSTFFPQPEGHHSIAAARFPEQ
jgi:hypothetical protein